MNRMLITTFLVFMVAAPFSAHAQQFALYWPEEVLQAGKDLEIIELSISVACGQFRAVRNIPEDWNLEIIRPISARTELKASAGHGGSHLQNMLPLNGVIVISLDEATCFDVKAQLVSFSALRSYGKAQLQLKKESNRSLHSDRLCLRFEPTVESIVGTLVRETFPGPPNYQSIKAGDQPETGWYVKLIEPICFAETPGEGLNNKDVTDVKIVQLVLTHGEYKSHGKLLGEKVKATGTFFTRHTGHHHTPVLLQVRTLERAE